MMQLVNNWLTCEVMDAGPMSIGQSMYKAFDASRWSSKSSDAKSSSRISIPVTVRVPME